MSPTQTTEKSLLFTPIRFGRVEAKNRICISPMCMYSAKDGLANHFHVAHYGARAIGGAGIVMVEATGVEPRGRITSGCLGIWSDAHVEAFRPITELIKSQGSIPAIQLAHAGRKASRQPPWIGRDIPLPEGERWEILAPSALPFDTVNNFTPKEASLDDIAQVRQDFIEAAKRAQRAGFEIIEFHFAHGYLVSSFLSPLANKRTDQYGGSFENRSRLALEIIQGVKQVLPEDYPLFVRISCTDHVEGGWTLEESVQLARKFKQLGVALIDCSSGGNVNLKKHFVNNNVDQIVYSEKVHWEAEIDTGAVGNIISPKWAEQILSDNRASLIFIGRISLDDPNWSLHAAYEIGAENQFEILPQYNWGIGSKTTGQWRQKALVVRNQDQLDGLIY